MEDAYSQHAVGLLDEIAFANMKATLKAAFSAPGLRAGWRLARNQFDADSDFVAFMDALLAETAPVAVRELTVRWKETIAAERALVVQTAN